MLKIISVALICASSIQPQDCTRENASDIFLTKVDSLFACMMQTQAISAGTGIVAEGHYLKIRCESPRDEHASVQAR